MIKITPHIQRNICTEISDLSTGLKKEFTDWVKEHNIPLTFCGRIKKGILKDTDYIEFTDTYFHPLSYAVTELSIIFYNPEDEILFKLTWC